MTTTFATFNIETSVLTSNSKGLWERRNDLRGLSLTSATLEWDPYERIVVNEQFDITEAEGMVIDVMRALQVRSTIIIIPSVLLK